MLREVDVISANFREVVRAEEEGVSRAGQTSDPFREWFEALQTSCWAGGSGPSSSKNRTWSKTYVKATDVQGWKKPAMENSVKHMMLNRACGEERNEARTEYLR